jgi:hypothetical protein
MRLGFLPRSILALLVMIVGVVVSADQQGVRQELSGYVSLEPRIYPHRSAFSQQPASGLSWSAVLAPELRLEWPDGRSRVAIEPFVRVDQHDSERTHADLREASWLYVDGPWALRGGLSRVFWGVTESRHLVDIVNQTDLVEDIDGESKLGQPMIHVERSTARGTVGAFLLPGFRERTFPADDARVRGPLPISDRATYESSAGRRRTDLALRWTHVDGPWDLGFSVFHGNSREPRLVFRPGESTAPELVPHYDVITQIGTDVQHTRDAWLWKLEAIIRHGHDRAFVAAVGGFEYTTYGVAGSAADVGVLVEALYDGRDPEAPPAIFGDGLFAGVRVALNDADDTRFLAGVLVDPGGAGSLALIEVERRVGERWRVDLEARLLSGIDATEPFLHGFRKDSYVTLRVARYF